MSDINDTIKHSFNHAPSYMINHSQTVLTNIGLIDHMKIIHHLIYTPPSTEEFKIWL